MCKCFHQKCNNEYNNNNNNNNNSNNDTELDDFSDFIQIVIPNLYKPNQPFEKPLKSGKLLEFLMISGGKKIY